MLESSLKPEQNKLVSVRAMAWCGIKWLPVVKCQVTGSPTGATQELCPKYRIQCHYVYLLIHIVNMCELHWVNLRKGEPIPVVDSSNVCLHILTRHGVTTFFLSACSRPDGNIRMQMLNALHLICVSTAFSSRQVFKPHLKPYTGRTVKRQDFAVMHINWSFSFVVQKKGNA